MNRRTPPESGHGPVNVQFVLPEPSGAFMSKSFNMLILVGNIGILRLLLPKQGYGLHLFFLFKFLLL